MRAQKVKILKMKPGPALLNSLYGTKGKQTVFDNLWGRPHGRSPEDVKDTPFGGAKAQNKRQKAKIKARKAKMKENKDPKGQNKRK